MNEQCWDCMNLLMKINEVKSSKTGIIEIYDIILLV